MFVCDFGSPLFTASQPGKLSTQVTTITGIGSERWPKLAGQPAEPTVCWQEQQQKQQQQQGWLCASMATTIKH